MTAHKLAEEEWNQLDREKHTSPQPYTKNDVQKNKAGNGGPVLNNLPWKYSWMSHQTYWECDFLLSRSICMVSLNNLGIHNKQANDHWFWYFLKSRQFTQPLCHSNNHYIMDFFPLVALRLKGNEQKLCIKRFCCALRNCFDHFNGPLVQSPNKRDTCGWNVLCCFVKNI